jgi:hypothetical protein
MAVVVIGSAEHYAEIRSMAGGPTATEITPTKIEGYYNDAKDWVENGTGIDIEEVLSTDTGYSNIKNAITFRASVLIRYGWRDKENKAQEHSVEARRLTGDIIKSSEQATAADSTSSHQTTSEYRTPNMIESSQNPGLPYQSPDFSF